MSDRIIGSGFQTLMVRGSFTLAILPLKEGRARVTAKPSILEKLSIHPDRVKARLEVVELEELSPDDQVFVYLPTMQRLEVLGNVRAVLKGWVFDTLHLDHRSQAPLVADGFCDRLYLDYESDSPADLSRFQVRNGTVAVHGAGTVTARVDHRLMADINGQGNLRLLHRPEEGVTHRRNRKGGDLVFLRSTETKDD